MQFGFRSGRGTTDAIFIVRQIQEMFLEKKRDLWMAFVDLERAFDRVPRKVVWWALRRLGVEEWLVTVTIAMYEGVTTAVKMNEGESDGFDVKVGVHQGLAFCCSLLSWRLCLASSVWTTLVVVLCDNCT